MPPHLSELFTVLSSSSSGGHGSQRNELYHRAREMLNSGSGEHALVPSAFPETPELPLLSRRELKVDIDKLLQDENSAFGELEPEDALVDPVKVPSKASLLEVEETAFDAANASPLPMNPKVRMDLLNNNNSQY